VLTSQKESFLALKEAFNLNYERRKEEMNFENLIKILGIIMIVVKKMQSLVRSQTLIVLRSLLGLENQVK